MTTPRYMVKLRDDGTIRIMNTDGNDMSEADLTWIKRAIQVERAREAISNSPNMKKHMRTLAQQEGEIVQGYRFQIDQFILDLERIRKRLIPLPPRASIAAAMFCKPHQLTDYVTGRSRPQMEMLRMWAYVSQHLFMLVPIELREQVQALVDAWWDKQKQEGRAR